MYEKDKTRRVTVRLSEEQADALFEACEILGISPSDYFRMVCNALRVQVRKGGFSSNEHDKTDNNYQL